MPYPHPIALRGKWEYEVLTQASPGETPPRPRSGELQVPADWHAILGADFRGVVRFRRRCGRPGQLDPHERLWLVCDGASAWAELSFNGRLLGRVPGACQPAEFDVTDQLQPRNEIWLDVHSEDGETAPTVEQGIRRGPVGGVRFEVRDVGRMKEEGGRLNNGS